MENFFSKIIKACDLFGVMIQFNYKKNSYLKTHFGGVLSILLGIISIFLFYLFGREIFDRDKPFIRYSKVQKDYSDIHYEDFPLIISLSLNGNIDDINRYVSLKLEAKYTSSITSSGPPPPSSTSSSTSTSSTTTGTTTASSSISSTTSSSTTSSSTTTSSTTDSPTSSTTSSSTTSSTTTSSTSNTTTATHQPFYNATLVLCNLDSHFTGKYKEAIANSSLDISTFYCIEGGYNKTYFNDYKSANSTSFSINLNRCQNKTTNTCATSSEIDEALKRFMMKLYYIDITINAQMFTNYLNYKINTMTVPSSYDQLKTLTVSIKNTLIETDAGLISDEPVPVTIPQFSDYSSETMTLDDRGSLIKVNFSSPRLGDNYSRSYLKLTDLAAKLGGILNVLFIIGNYVCKLISETSFYLQQARDLVTFEEIEKNVKVLNECMPQSPKSPRRSTITNTQMTDINIQTEVHPNVQTKTHRNSQPEQMEIELENKRKLKKNMTLINNIKNETLKTRVNKNKIGFCGIIKVFCKCDKDSQIHKKFYAALIDYFESQLDIVNFIKSKLDLNTIKFVLFSDREDYDRLFKIKIPVEDILTSFEVTKNYFENDIEEIENDEITYKEQTYIRNTFDKMQVAFSKKKIFMETEVSEE